MIITRRTTNRRISILVLILGSIFSPALRGQESQQKAEPQPASKEQTAPAVSQNHSLEKDAQNPVAALISVPVQENLILGIDPGNRTKNVLNIQPVVPLSVNKNWNLIVRWISPIVYQPLPAFEPAPQVGVSGLGDMQPTFFLSPKHPGKLIWGVGPAALLPTATSHDLGQGKLGLGPGIVLLTQPTGWTLGVVTNNIWSVAGSGSRPSVNQMTLQYFVTRNLKKGWYVAMQPIITANWEATNGGRLVLPFGGGVGRIMRLGPQPVNVSIQAYGNAVYPVNGSPWSIRAQLVFLYPKHHAK